MWTLVYRQQINISHFLALNYTSRDSRAHGHLLDISITVSSTRLNANNMIIDTNTFKNFLDKMDHISTNEYMRNNNLKGNATLENIILIVKTKSLMVLQKENETYNTDVILARISVKDETGREVVYVC